MSKRTNAGKALGKAKGKGKGPLYTTGEDAENIDLGLMSLEKFRLWSDHALRNFLALRNKTTEGTFEELVSRAFVAWEEKLDCNPNVEHQMRQNVEDYKSKLRGEDPLPDPFTLNDGWVGEDDMSEWPQMYFHDIADYLKANTPLELYQRLCCEYKQGKAYRYFTDNHVLEISYHPISSAASFAFFAARVKPSMRSCPAYQVWVAVEKATKDQPGGTIRSAYCTCTAGLHGTCNHVAGLLFRVEYFVRTGKTNPSRTSVLCQWNKPSGTGVEICKPLTELLWKKEQYLNQDHDDHQESVRQLALNFTPLTPSQEAYCSSDKIVDEFAAAFKEIAPESSFIQMHYSVPFPKPVQAICPPSPIELAKSFAAPDPVTHDFISVSKSKFCLSAAERTDIEVATQGQTYSEEWKEQRQGRITASKFKRVYTRMVSLSKDCTESPAALIADIMGYKTKKATAAMKHGLSMEQHAKVKYRKLMRKKHRKFTTSNSGLVISEERYHLGASPDLVIACECHGKGLCEIKCPFSIRSDAPNHANYSAHLTIDKETNQPCLSKNSPYYFQIQGQMAILKVDYCDFFVYTAHGEYLERVSFNEEFWEKVASKLTEFWDRYILPELFKAHAEQQDSTNNGPHTDHMYGIKFVCGSDVDHSSESDHTYSTRSTSANCKNPLTKPILAKVYLCGVCAANVEGNDEIPLVCSDCGRKFHSNCVNLTKDELEHLIKDWLCDGCIVSQVQDQ